MGSQLYVVATPIGNLEDITLRALETLRNVDVIAAEDTRKTGRLLSRHGIRKRLVSHHEHNEKRSAEGLIKLLQEGMDVALVTNAGTPLLSDPGYSLVSRAIEEGIDVGPLPGPCSITTALSVSDLPVHEFHFLGFAPKKKGALDKALHRAANLGGTVIFLESPHRLAKFLEAAQLIIGDRKAVVAREMTKLHEEIAHGTLPELARIFANRTVKGEVVILIGA